MNKLNSFTSTGALAAPLLTLYPSKGYGRSAIYVSVNNIKIRTAELFYVFCLDIGITYIKTNLNFKWDGIPSILGVVVLKALPSKFNLHNPLIPFGNVGFRGW